MCKDIITSKNNNLIKQVKIIRDDKKYREENSLCFIEGERLVFDTPKKLIYKIFVSKSFKDINNKLKKFDSNKIIYIDDKIFDSMKDTKNSQGIIAVCKTNIKTLTDNTLNNNYLILDDINDPGNLGAILRISEAMGFNNIIVSKNSCDIYNPKTLRASMSSIFRLNIYKSDNLINDIKLLKNNNYIIYGTILKNAKDYLNVKFTNNKFGLILGNEANGINKKLYDYIDEKIKVNMNGDIESLNVAIAYAIIASEIKRQNELNA